MQKLLKTICVTLFYLLISSGINSQSSQVIIGNELGKKWDVHRIIGEANGKLYVMIVDPQVVTTAIRVLAIDMATMNQVSSFDLEVDKGFYSREGFDNMIMCGDFILFKLVKQKKNGKKYDDTKFYFTIDLNGTIVSDQIPVEEMPGLMVYDNKNARLCLTTTEYVDAVNGSKSLKVTSKVYDKYLKEVSVHVTEKNLPFIPTGKPTTSVRGVEGIATALCKSARAENEVLLKSGGTKKADSQANYLYVFNLLDLSTVGEHLLYDPEESGIPRSKYYKEGVFELTRMNKSPDQRWISGFASARTNGQKGKGMLIEQSSNVHYGLRYANSFNDSISELEKMQNEGKRVDWGEYVGSPTMLFQSNPLGLDARGNSNWILTECIVSTEINSGLGVNNKRSETFSHVTCFNPVVVRVNSDGQESVFPLDRSYKVRGNDEYYDVSGYLGKNGLFCVYNKPVSDRIEICQEGHQCDQSVLDNLDLTIDYLNAEGKWVNVPVDKSIEPYGVLTQVEYRPNDGGLILFAFDVERNLHALKISFFE